MKARAVVKDSVVERVTGVLLYMEAKKQAPANIDDVLEKAVKKEESKFLALHGNDWGKAQAVLREEGMDLEQFEASMRARRVTKARREDVVSALQEFALRGVVQEVGSDLFT